MYRKKCRYIPKKYKNEFRVISSRVSKIVEQNKVINEKYKTVFYCDSTKNPEGQMCVVWGNTTIRPGDEVLLEGRFVNNVFAVWSITKSPIYGGNK